MDLDKIRNGKDSLTLEDITQRKKEVLKTIRNKQENMSECSQRIFAPFLPSADDGSNSFIKKFNAGIAIADGVILGMRVIKRFRSFFKKKRY